MPRHSTIALIGVECGAGGITAYVPAVVEGDDPIVFVALDVR